MNRPNNDGASAIADRLPPQNLEAERSLLGSCLLDQRMIDEAIEILTSPADFYRDSHREAWEAMLVIREAGDPVDAVTLADRLIKAGRFYEIGGDDFLREIVNAVPIAANARYYAGIVRERAIARRVLEEATETIREVYSNTKTASELICATEERFFAIGEAEAGLSWGAEDLVGESMARLDVRRAGGSPGLETGYTQLDLMTGGFQPGGLVILAARPSQGKTALGLDICRRVAVETPVLFVSLEMSRHEIGDRLLSSQGSVPGSLLHNARMMSERHMQSVYGAANALSRLRFRIDDSARRTVGQIAAQARRMKRRYGLGLVVIDYLGLIDGQRQKGESRQEEVARISRGLKASAKNLMVPFLVLCQLNRQSEHRDGRRPELSDLRESGQIEQDADLVMMLHRPEFYDADDQPGVAELMIKKNRNGATGTIRLAFRKECTAFDSLEPVDPIDMPAF